MQGAQPLDKLKLCLSSHRQLPRPLYENQQRRRRSMMEGLDFHRAMMVEVAAVEVVEGTGLAASSYSAFWPSWDF
ncbi:unnamed protein product [Linum tenue]|uniref:Uncharacterized protein n=1 Tax=Linum tenue TaxID=586396 RepID=A0AAV0GXX8_9ROSI|nr:unnamed protein product [Linum tenue]